MKRGENINQQKCKICRLGFSNIVNYLRFYRSWKQAEIAEYLESISDVEFNTYNVSNHLNFHVSEDERRFWKALLKKFPNEAEMSTAMREALYQRVKTFY